MLGHRLVPEGVLVCPDHPIVRSSGPKSFVNDFRNGHGVVLGRAATTLRSIETQPFDWMICSCQLDKSSGCRGQCFLEAGVVGLVHFFPRVFNFFLTLSHCRVGGRIFAGLQTLPYRS